MKVLATSSYINVQLNEWQGKSLAKWPIALLVSVVVTPFFTLFDIVMVVPQCIKHRTAWPLLPLALELTGILLFPLGHLFSKDNMLNAEFFVNMNDFMSHQQTFWSFFTIQPIVLPKHP
jgi:hypothetical protein